MNEQHPYTDRTDRGPVATFIGRQLEGAMELRVRDIPAHALGITGGYEVIKNVFSKEPNVLEATKGSLKVFAAFVIASTGKH